MSFWLATLNPGKTATSRRGRGSKRRRTRRGGRKLWGAALAAHLKKIGKKRHPARKRKKSFRRQMRQAMRSIKMAKTARRSRKAKRSRRAKRNSWFKEPIRHARASRKGWRRRRSKRNPWAHLKVWRTKRGRFGTRRGHRRYRRNSVGPVAWNRRRGGHRRYRRNSVVPIAWNPLGGLTGRGGLLGGVLERAQRFLTVNFWTETALPAVGGFIGTKAIGSVINGFLADKLLKISPADAAAPWVRLGCDVLAVGVVSSVGSKFLGTKQGEAIFIGGVVSSAHRVLKRLLGGTEIARMIGLEGLGNDYADRMREAVAQRVYSQLNGVGTYLQQRDMLPQPGVAEYVTERALRSQPGYAPLPSADMREYDVARSETTL